MAVSVPDKWELDYDGNRWFYRYKPTGIIQYRFPQPGDEFPEFLAVSDHAVDLSLEEKATTEQQHQPRRLSTCANRPRRWSQLAIEKQTKREGRDVEDGGDDSEDYAIPMARTLAGPLDQVAAFWFMPELFTHMGPGDDDDDDIKEETDKARTGVAELPASEPLGASPLGQISELPAEVIAPHVTEKVTRPAELRATHPHSSSIITISEQHVAPSDCTSSQQQPRSPELASNIDAHLATSANGPPLMACQAVQSPAGLAHRPALASSPSLPTMALPCLPDLPTVISGSHVVAATPKTQSTQKRTAAINIARARTADSQKSKPSPAVSKDSAEILAAGLALAQIPKVPTRNAPQPTQAPSTHPHPLRSNPVRLAPALNASSPPRHPPASPKVCSTSRIHEKVSRPALSGTGPSKPKSARPGLARHASSPKPGPVRIAVPVSIFSTRRPQTCGPSTSRYSQNQHRPEPGSGPAPANLRPCAEAAPPPPAKSIPPPPVPSKIALVDGWGPARNKRKASTLSVSTHLRHATAHSTTAPRGPCVSTSSVSAVTTHSHPRKTALHTNDTSIHAPVVGAEPKASWANASLPAPETPLPPVPKMRAKPQLVPVVPPIVITNTAPAVSGRSCESGSIRDGPASDSLPGEKQNTRPDDNTSVGMVPCGGATAPKPAADGDPKSRPSSHPELDMFPSPPCTPRMNQPGDALSFPRVMRDAERGGRDTGAILGDRDSGFASLASEDDAHRNEKAHTKSADAGKKRGRHTHKAWNTVADYDGSGWGWSEDYGTDLI